MPVLVVAVVVVAVVVLVVVVIAVVPFLVAVEVMVFLVPAKIAVAVHSFFCDVASVLVVQLWYQLLAVALEIAVAVVVFERTKAESVVPVFAERWVLI